MSFYMDQLIKDGQVTQPIISMEESGQLLWQLIDGMVRCPWGSGIDLHDPDTFQSRLEMIEEAMKGCAKSLRCHDDCPFKTGKGVQVILK
jgi:hypothetical protein